MGTESTKDILHEQTPRKENLTFFKSAVVTATRLSDEILFLIIMRKNHLYLIIRQSVHHSQSDMPHQCPTGAGTAPRGVRLGHAIFYFLTKEGGGAQR